jgi:hypothetical protein
MLLILRLMKLIQSLYGQTLILIVLVVGLAVLNAQENPFQAGDTTDLAALLQTIEATTPLPASQAPDTANGFYSVQNLNWPPLPGNVLGLEVWPLGDGTFLLDDRDVDYAATAGGGGMRAMDVSGPPNPGGADDGTNAYSPNIPAYFTPTTNDLWLQITGKTNAMAYLVIHPPWNVTNGVYDLLYTTNLAPAIRWQWLLRTDPGQTNLVVSNATDSQGFYRLAPPNDLIANDSLGTNFWVAFMYMDSSSEANLSFYISSPVGATGTVNIPSLGITSTFSLAAGAVTNIALNGSIMPDYSDNDMVLSNGIQVTTSQPVSVYAFNYSQANSVAFTCYPVPLLGTNYCLMARSAGTVIGGYNYSSRFVIVATADNTTVSITPSPTAYLVSSDYSFDYTTNYIVSLPHQGQTYQIGSDGGDTGNFNDVTGTLVTSDKPVAIFAGASSAYVPDNIVAANPLVQEQLPVGTWGTQALSIGFAGRLYGDTYRVLAAYSNNVVTITTTNGTFTTNLTTGAFCDTNLAGPVAFQGSQPIQVAHFANGWQFDHPDTQEGDPC